MIETMHMPTAERAQEFARDGYQLDTAGRPFHPWMPTRTMELPESSPLWKWGPNAAADAIVFNSDQPQVLLIQRPEGIWANAGGFIDQNDNNPAHAAAREAYEEAGISLNVNDGLPVYEGIVHDIRASKYSWVTTAAFLWRTCIKLDELHAGDDAQAIKLVDLSAIRGMQLSGSHNQLIESAVDTYGTTIEKLHYYHADCTREPAHGGHMGYERSIVTLPTGEQFFTKQYSPQLYTDTERAAHSLLYLQKEHAMYEHAKQHGYTRIPGATDYQSGTLAMEALTKKDGWQWQHPNDQPALRHYIDDALTAANELSKIPLPAEQYVAAAAQGSYINEGWAKYNYDTKKAMIKRLFDYAAAVRNDDFSDIAYRIVDNLDVLYKHARNIDYAQPTVFSHHDFRQSNIAWHESQGVKIVDWSWAGPGFKNADATMFLIDLHKRGVDVQEYMEHFNKDHALLVIGFWLTHSTLPAFSDTDVRFQQLHSAVAAYDLLATLK